MPALFTCAKRSNSAAFGLGERAVKMTDQQLLDRFSGKQRMAVEMALRLQGVTQWQMLNHLGMPLLNTLRSIHHQGLADLVTFTWAGETHYKLVTSAIPTDSQRARAAMASIIAEAFQNLADDE